MPLLLLPAEVHLNVLGHLPYESLLQMSATSKHFRQLFLNHRQITIEALFDLEERFYADAKEILRPDGWTRLFPCYECFKLLEQYRFKIQERKLWFRTQIRGQHLTTPWELRSCMTCAIPEDMKRWTNVFLLRFMIDDRQTGIPVTTDHPWIYCNACKIAWPFPYVPYSSARTQILFDISKLYDRCCCGQRAYLRARLTNPPVPIIELNVSETIPWRWRPEVPPGGKPHSLCSAAEEEREEEG